MWNPKIAPGSMSGQLLSVLAILAILFTMMPPAPIHGQTGAGYALQFDGTTDFVRLAETASIMASGWKDTKTVSLWVRPTGTATCTVPDVAQCDAIFGDRPRWWGISRGTIGGNDRIWVWNYDGSYDVVAVPYDANEWVHIALVHNGGTLAAYKNGFLVGSVPSGTTQQPDTGAQPVLHIGGVINNATRNWTFQGRIDEVRIWNAALDATTLQAWMFQELTTAHPNWSDLAAYYKMSNGSGAALTDDSGNGWTGVLEDGGSGVPADGPITWVLSGAFDGAPNNPPVADNQTVTTAEDTPVDITLTGSDSDSDPITYHLGDLPTHGTVTGTPPEVAYTPDPDFHGSDSFTFKVNDGAVDSAVATVDITVEPVNDPPQATADEAATNEDIAITLDVLGNDDDIDGDVLTITVVSAAAHGVVVNNDADLTYTPAADFNGPDAFTYTISDGNGGEATAQVTVTVEPVNDPPDPVDDLATTPEDTAVVIDVLSNDTDAEGDSLTLIDVSSPAFGSVITGSQIVTYTPNLNFNGDDSFTYLVSDGQGGSAFGLVTVTVTSVNDPPVAQDDPGILTDEDVALTIPVLDNDSDIDGDDLTITDVGDAGNGMVTNNGIDVTYTPAADFNGADAFTYTISDGNGGEATAQVTVTVEPVNDPPVALDDAVTTDFETSATIDVLANDSDVDSLVITVSSVGLPANGAAVNNGTDVTYTPAAAFSGTDTFTYTISDGSGGSDTAQVTVTVNPAAEPPRSFIYLPLIIR